MGRQDMAPKYYPKVEVFSKGEKKQKEGGKGKQKKEKGKKEGKKKWKVGKGKSEEERKKKRMKGVEQPSCRWQQINIHPSVHRH